MSTIARIITVLSILFAFALGAAPVQAETINCSPITTLPTIIIAQGVYCFIHDLTTAMTSGNAIAINTNNVTIDLNGFKLGGLSAGPGTSAHGIFALDRQNITIKNGTIRGFFRGIYLQDIGASQGHVIEDIRADQNTFIGIQALGKGVIVRNNQVVATGGATCCGAVVNGTGIYVGGTGSQVLNNSVIETVKVGPATASGIFLFSGTDGVVVNNRIIQADRGIYYNSGATGKYRDNVTSSVTTPYTGGTDIGNNN